MSKTKYKDRLKVLFITSEATPLAKAGGLGDVAGSLPKVLARDYHMEIRIVMPKYKCINTEKFPMEHIAYDLKVKMQNNKLRKINVYKTYLPETIVPIMLLDMPEVFTGDDVYDHKQQGRETNLTFIYFSKAAMELIRAMDWRPDIIHIQDWMMGMVPKWLRTIYHDYSFFQKTATALTIHNIAFQGKFDYHQARMLGLKRRDFKETYKINKKKEINTLGEAVLNADMINTVSPNYAREILTKKYGYGLQKLLQSRKNNFTGILNGMDYSSFDPRTNEDTPVKYWIDSLDKKVENKLFLQKKLGLTQSPDLPLICVVSRITPQKGLDLVDEVLNNLVDMGAQFVILGSGSEKIEKLFIKAEKEHPKEIAAEMVFDSEFAQTIYAGSDMMLMPSRFEPCGLSQIIAMRFGTIPIVRKTGGLADTVKDGYTGFVFRHYDKEAFLWAIRRAVDVYYNQKDYWRKMQIRCMKKDFSWRASAKKYIWLYKKAVKSRKKYLENIANQEKSKKEDKK